MVNPPKEGVIQCENDSTAVDLPPLTIVNLPCGCKLDAKYLTLINPSVECHYKANLTINTGINIPIFVGKFKGFQLHLDLVTFESLDSSWEVFRDYLDP